MSELDDLKREHDRLLAKVEAVGPLVNTPEHARMLREHFVANWKTNFERVEAECDSLRAQLVEARTLVRSEQHPDCVVLLRAALPWLYKAQTAPVEAERDSLRAQLDEVTKRANIGAQAVLVLRDGYDRDIYNDNPDWWGRLTDVLVAWDAVEAKQ